MFERATKPVIIVLIVVDRSLKIMNRAFVFFGSLCALIKNLFFLVTDAIVGVILQNIESGLNISEPGNFKKKSAFHIPHFHYKIEKKKINRLTEIIFQLQFISKMSIRITKNEINCVQISP